VLDESVMFQRGDERLLHVQLETDVLGYKFLENETASFVVDLADERAWVPAEVLKDDQRVSIRRVEGI
jgi:hypothetical protein